MPQRGEKYLSPRWVREVPASKERKVPSPDVRKFTCLVIACFGNGRGSNAVIEKNRFLAPE